MTDTRYAEFENVNGYRSYPFSESSSMEDVDGVAFPDDVFVDAVVYPVNPSGRLHMTLFDPSSGVEISDSSGVVASGALEAGSRAVRLFRDGRMAGTLVPGPGFDREVLSMRRREFDGTAELSPGAVCPISHGGVMSVSFPGPGFSVTGWGQMVFAGKGRLVAMSSPRGDGEYDVFFNVEGSPGDSGDSGDGPYVKEIHVVTSGRTLFRADPEASSGAYLWLVNADGGRQGQDPGLGRDDICSRAHLADASGPGSIPVVRDTCDVDPESCVPKTPLPSMSEHFAVSGDGVWLYTYDLADYLNPIKVEHVRGSTSRPQPSAPVGAETVEEFEDEVMKLVASPVQTGFGLEISIPGASHG